MTYEVNIGDLDYSYIFDENNYYFKQISEADLFEKKMNECMMQSDCKSVKVLIKSQGGYAQIAMDICNQIMQFEEKAKDKGIEIVGVIDTFTASGGSDIAFAFEKTVAKKYSLVMIHKTWTYVGNANSDLLKQQADILDKFDEIRKQIYKKKANLNDKQLSQIFNDKDVYLTPAELLEYGLIQSIES